MPRRAASGSLPNWNHLLEIASEQAGYLTSAQAREAGFSRPLLQHHIATGKLQRAGRAIFRVRWFPSHPFEEYVVPWLWSERAGVFSHTTALALHQLSDVLPSRMHLTLPSSWARRRLKVPEGVLLHYADIPPRERTWHEFVPVTTPIRAVRECTDDGLPGDLLDQAIREGLQRGLFTTADLQNLTGVPPS